MFLIIKNHPIFAFKHNIGIVGKTVYQWKLSFTKVKWEKIELILELKDDLNSLALLQYINNILMLTLTCT